MVSRLLFTVAVALSLTGVYVGYAVCMQPLIQLPTLTVSSPVIPRAPVSSRPLENVRVAKTFLPQQEWAAQARYNLHSSNSFVYTNQWIPEGDAGRIRLQPFALVWMTKNPKTGDEEAITLVSESALVKFAGSFEMPDPKPGRMVTAQLLGRAQMTGPNGMLLDGRNFYFSEAGDALWSDSPVRFEYAGNRGSADKMQVNLIRQAGSPGNDRPHIFGVKDLQLSRNVQMKLQLEEKDEPLELTVNCSGSFIYDVLQQRAVYSDDVAAFRQTGPTEYDSIECDRLSLQFAAPDDGRPTRMLPDEGQPGLYQQLHPRLKFRWLQAEAYPNEEGDEIPVIRLSSTQHQLECRATTLWYHGDQQQVRLTHPEGVVILQARQPILQCPDVTFTLGDRQKLKSAMCRGPGWVVYRDPKDREIAFAADWRYQLQHGSDPVSGLDLIELREAASFRQPREESALGAELIRVWLRPAQTSSNDTKSNSALLTNMRQVELERMEAHENVVLVNPQVEARGKQLLVWLDHEAALSEPEGVMTASNEVEQPAAQDAPTEQSAKQPIDAHAETIRVRLRPRAGQTPDLADVWTEGRVVLEQPKTEETQGFTVIADSAHVENRNMNDQVLHLYGKPAVIRNGETQLEAGEMHLHRADNQFDIQGRGALQFPMTSDMEGKKLGTPALLNVSWEDRLSFDGQLATFRGNATAMLEGRRLSCTTMEVTLTEPINFMRPPTDLHNIQLKSITCRDHVELLSLIYEANKLIEKQAAEVWELHINRLSGEMLAQGPGVMEMWRRGKGPRTNLVASQSARPNAPIQLDASEWQYTRVKFDGRMDGHMHHHYAVFKERVEILHGPVKLPNQTLSRDQLPKGGGFMSCSVLEVRQVTLPDRPEKAIQIKGDGNAWLEGDGFAASADQIAFDEVRGTYQLVSRGKNKARLWPQIVPGVERPPVSLQRIEFNPDTREWRADGVSSGEGSR
ncbi:hypothetical protein GC163_07840 [bacterium]|nr:hypothetical protein [bacterium]